MIQDVSVIVPRGGSGFFSHFFQVLGSVLKIGERPVAPYVYFNRVFRYWSSEGYRGRRNAWEYYFKPLSDLRMSDLFSGDEASLEQMKNKELAERALPGVRVTSSYWWPLVGHYGIMSPDQRRACADLIRERIVLQDDVRAEFERVRLGILGDAAVVGVQYRGTDKGGEIRHAVGKTPIPFSEYEAAVDRCLERYPKARIFLATDSEQAWESAKRRYGRRLLSTDARRTSRSAPLHRNADPKMGEEVLMDVLLLSSCDALVHGISNVSAAAFCWNGSLECVDVYDPGNSVPGDPGPALPSA